MYFKESTGIAKPIPALPPLGEYMAVFIPISFPEESSREPPEFPFKYKNNMEIKTNVIHMFVTPFLPGFIAASV